MTTHLIIEQLWNDDNPFYINYLSLKEIEA